MEVINLTSSAIGASHENDGIVKSTRDFLWDLLYDTAKATNRRARPLLVDSVDALDGAKESSYIFVTEQQEGHATRPPRDRRAVMDRNFSPNIRNRSNLRVSRAIV